MSLARAVRGCATDSLPSRQLCCCRERHKHALEESERVTHTWGLIQSVSMVNGAVHGLMAGTNFEAAINVVGHDGSYDRKRAPTGTPRDERALGHAIPASEHCRRTSELHAGDLCSVTFTCTLVQLTLAFVGLVPALRCSPATAGVECASRGLQSPVLSRVTATQYCCPKGKGPGVGGHSLWR